MKKFRCMPVAIGIPTIFLLNILCWIILAIWEREKGMLLLATFFIVIELALSMYYMNLAIRRVELYSNRIVCKGLLPSQTYEIEYEKCNIGMDYSWRSGGKIWWIYICYGPAPRFKSASSLNRMNSVKFKPGFIKMHYNDKVYNALLEVLPKQQRSALIYAKKWADKDKK